MSHNFSPLNSPRSKTTRTTTQFNSEYQQAIFYIRYNIKTILRLVSNDLNNEDCMISSKDLSILQIILRPEIQKGKNNNNKINLSQYSQLFNNPQQKISAKVLSEYLTNTLSMNETQDNIVYIQGLTKSVMCKDEKSCENQDLRIVNCEDSYLYIDSYVYNLSISNCINMNIFVSAVQKICTIDKCENVNIVVASSFIRIGNTIDSTIHYYGSFNPVLYGDNRSINLAPHNGNYIELLEKVKLAKIPVCYKNCQMFQSPFVMNQNQCLGYQIMSLKDFFCINLPLQFRVIPYQYLVSFENVLNLEKQIQELKNNYQNNNNNKVVLPILAPNEYREHIIQRFQKYQELQNNIINCGLNENQQKLLQDAIQGYFREWMVQTGQIKPISDLVKMINQD
ncbi:tubulin-specific chaperone c, putative [Ichthyophthirius multifiliis]|uniref:Tubulin-specific chaperone c, putative n=1 Tax=Ichthyophthirius multifiliis TaxID=5932 RepID=G0QMC6_ICHMU|nr:tubulin-specific chaperone c, putative [Ichthyophthirius multifiliis]EGR33620.1 tubulin-specific chaperone c, putative [Ichthyophthirius multifiliis]|eukprot:XP_004037606.1 tubulin-specific chaperone c, putative [Ichthyophthirius multifiliis]